MLTLMVLEAALDLVRLCPVIWIRLRGLLPAAPRTHAATATA